MDALAQRRRSSAIDAMSEDSIEHEAGLSAHESKSWLVARGALRRDRALPCAAATTTRRSPNTSPASA